MVQHSDNSRPACYLSHHKCATMYANLVLGRICAELGLEKRVLYQPEEFSHDLVSVMRADRVDLLMYLDSEWSYVEDVGGITGVHVIRDPRDVLVSAYFSHRSTHQTATWPELRVHREKLQEVSKEEGLYLEMQFTGYVFRAMSEWDYDREGILELRFEELVDDPYGFWLRAIEHLGLLDGGDFGLRRSLTYSLCGIVNQAARKYAWWPFRLPLRRVPGARLLGIVYDNRFSKKTGGRAHGEEDAASHYRKGQPGDWKNHLTEDHLVAFESRFPGLLKRTGYA